VEYAEIDGLRIAYEVIGDHGAIDERPPWALTPGGRFSTEYPGVRETAEALAASGCRVLIWDRPNTGASDVCFSGETESTAQADALAGLLRKLGMAPAIIAGGSGGSRVSLLTATRHPDVAAGLAMWWISGGPYGLLSLGVHYCGNSIAAAWQKGMQAVVELPEWREVLERTPDNRKRMLDLDPREFIATLERWMLAYYPRDDELVPGVKNRDAAAITIPTLVFRSGPRDVHHTRATSETLAALIPTAQLVEPPWGEDEWIERTAAGDGLFVRWPLLVPQLLDWSAEVTGS
jgi:pimeloyl-ACP methyl ester carboxylesterase